MMYCMCDGLKINVVFFFKMSCKMAHLHAEMMPSSHSTKKLNNYQVASHSE